MESITTKTKFNSKEEVPFLEPLSDSYCIFSFMAERIIVRLCPSTTTRGL